MQTLHFPQYTFRIKNSENKHVIFDAIRKKFVHLTPEEWVRQHTVNYILDKRWVRKNLMNVEKQVVVGRVKKRYDIIAFNPNGSVYLVVECKAPSVQIDQHVFDQIARYNMTLQSKYLMVTNGLQHYYCTIDYQRQKYQFVEQLPQYTPTY